MPTPHLLTVECTALDSNVVDMVDQSEDTSDQEAELLQQAHSANPPGDTSHQLRNELTQYLQTLQGLVSQVC